MIAQPLWRYAENPVIAAAAEAMFNDPKSKWNPILTPPTFSQSWHEELVCSRLLELASFRRQVLRCLNSTTPVAYLKIDEKNRVEYEDARHNYINNPNFENVPDNDPQAVGPGTQTIRDCDRYAKMLSYVHAHGDGIPLAASDADIAIRQMRDFLTRYGPCIRFDERFSRDENLDVYSFDAAQVIFPPIGHPASAADVDGKPGDLFAGGSRRTPMRNTAGYPNSRDLDDAEEISAGSMEPAEISAEMPDLASRGSERRRQVGALTPASSVRMRLPWCPLRN